MGAVAVFVMLPLSSYGFVVVVTVFGAAAGMNALSMSALLYCIVLFTTVVELLLVDNDATVGMEADCGVAFCDM